jgi:hypothetical protein
MSSELVLAAPAAIRADIDRVAKAAMEEGMTEQSQLHGSRLLSPYRLWG